MLGRGVCVVLVYVSQSVLMNSREIIGKGFDVCTVSLGANGGLRFLFIQLFPDRVAGFDDALQILAGPF